MGLEDTIYGIGSKNNKIKEDTITVSSKCWYYCAELYEEHDYPLKHCLEKCYEDSKKE